MSKQQQYPTREQIAEVIDRVWNVCAESDHLSVDMADAVLALFPQPTPTAVLTGGIGYPVHEAARREDARNVAPATPPSIADMAPGTEFRAPMRGAPERLHEWKVTPYGALAVRLWTPGFSDRIDPSMVRDVTPPPVTP